MHHGRRFVKTATECYVCGFTRLLFDEAHLIPARRTVAHTLLVLALIPPSLVPAGCARGQAVPEGATSVGEWTNLLDGSASVWRGYRMDSLPSGWRFDAATSELTRASGGGDIITRAQYGDFEMDLEWKVGTGGNSGIFYRATEGTDIIYKNAAEMQILDNAGHRDGRNALTSTGSSYGLYAPGADVSRPVGEWNQVRIVAIGPHIEHWLNGTKVVQYEMGSAEWRARVQATKFSQWPAYGQSRSGHIGLQDHGDVVWFRNIRIRELRR